VRKLLPLKREESMRTISICVVAIAAIAISSGAGAQYRGNGYGSGSNSGGVGGSINLGTGSNSNSNQVDGYTRNNGTVVQPYERTNPNGSKGDNYGASGNYNPNKPRF
jgi:hypothetical protein